ncbi:MAG: UDP-N-acetylglucosamine 2-epimerase [Syntrophomonas sp.]
MGKKILFLTGTRADFGKLKPLMKAVEENPRFTNYVFVTGMHTLRRYGLTAGEVLRTGFKNVHVYMNQVNGDPMDIILSSTITGMSRFINEYRPDMIVVHGDRVEALAGAIVGSLNNILVAHIEGGEVSGTIDGLIRHSISKLAHIHFVSNEEARYRLVQMGENPNAIFVIGSPDVDVMLSSDLPTLDDARERYEIPFQDYSLVLFHPVTSEIRYLKKYAQDFTGALLDSQRNYVVVYPNNDMGCDKIFDAYKILVGNPRFKLFPSIRFEYFLSLLKNSKFMIGNSSAGIREAPIYGVHSINVGTRQQNRFDYPSIINICYEKDSILIAINKIDNLAKPKPCFTFGKGNSTLAFMKAIQSRKLWKVDTQKTFLDLPIRLKDGAQLHRA